MNSTGTLIITNGDAVALKIARTGIEGTVLPWRDVLHEGPVAGGLGLEALSHIRASFIEDRGWVGPGEARAAFARRDAVIRAWRDYNRLVLMFEHDLYDQLQLIQVLDFLAVEGAEPDRIEIVCVDSYPGVHTFHGLGQLEAAQLADLYDHPEAVSHRMLDTARSAWQALGSDDPRRIEALLLQDTSALPFLAAALLRLLQELPSSATGLSLTEQQILELLNSGPRSFSELFLAAQAREAAPFYGDSVFWWRVERLAHLMEPLLSVTAAPAPHLAGTGTPSNGQRIAEITEAGRRILRGGHVQHGSRGLRWLGGVLLGGCHLDYLWNAATQQVVLG